MASCSSDQLGLRPQRQRQVKVQGQALRGPAPQLFTEGPTLWDTLPTPTPAGKVETSRKAGKEGQCPIAAERS